MAIHQVQGYSIVRAIEHTQKTKLITFDAANQISSDIEVVAQGELQYLQTIEEGWTKGVANSVGWSRIKWIKRNETRER